MKNNLSVEILKLITDATANIAENQKGISARKIAFKQILSIKIVKLAFDSRRIDPLVTMNPRRGLQNYSRSEPFISDSMVEKLSGLKKLEDVLQNIKNKFGRESGWHDSNARTLLQNLEAGLRTNIKDGDYTEAQPGVGNLNYIEQLLNFRYRLNSDDLKSIASKDLEKVILAKDDILTQRDPVNAEIITKTDVSNNNYNDLIVKLLENVHATSENDCERSITITVKDRFIKTNGS